MFFLVKWNIFACISICLEQNMVEMSYLAEIKVKKIVFCERLREYHCFENTVLWAHSLILDFVYAHRAGWNGQIGIVWLPWKIFVYAVLFWAKKGSEITLCPSAFFPLAHLLFTCTILVRFRAFWSLIPRQQQQQQQQRSFLGPFERC